MSTYRGPRVEALGRVLPLPNALARRDVRWLSSVFALALALRLVFSLGVSRIQVVWDAAAYWGDAQGIRASTCDALHYCHAAPGTRIGFSRTVDLVVFSKDGIMPLLQGLILTVFPNTVTTALVVFAILDALACAMIASIVLRLGGSLWAGVLAGVVAAIYVPGIVGDGSFLQQPLIRFGLVAAVWGYACALTSDRYQRRFVAVGTGCLILVAFASESTRPLLWIVPAAVIAIAWRKPATRATAWMQVRASAVTASALFLLAILITLTLSGHTFASALTNLGLGLSTAGTAAGQVTVLSFQHFWPFDAWTYFANSNATHSLIHDFTRSPGQFTKLWAYSMYANWRLPDYLYFQNFVLGLRAQRLEHLAIVIPGFAGLAWLIGHSGARRLVGGVVLVTIAVMSLIAGVVDVEPRRVGALVPLVALGVACFVWSFAHRRTWRRFELAGVAALAIFCVVWAVSLPDVLALFPLSPDAGHWMLVVARATATALVGAWVLRDWHRHWPGFSVAFPAALGALLLLLIVTSQLEGGGWRAWTTSTREPIRQQIDGLRADAHQQPWLIVDFNTTQDAAAAEIYVNGRVLKRSGTPMRRWQIDGALLGWEPYVNLEQMSGGREPHTWMAFPMTSNTLAASRLTIEIRSPRSGLRIAGDYGDGSTGRYTGPSLDPSLDGFSLWRWLWNGQDPRIAQTQHLDARYASSMFDGRAWRSSDLSAGLGRTAGLYRIFVTQEPFGPRTNVLQGALSTAAAAPSRCAPGTGFFTTATASASSPYVCTKPTGPVTYYSATGKALGTSDPKVFSTAAKPGALVDRTDTATGTIEVIALGGPLFVANIYGVGHRLLYSLGFSYPAAPPTYL